MSSVASRLREVLSTGGGEPAIWQDSDVWSWHDLDEVRAALVARLATPAAGQPVGVLMRTAFGPVAAQLALLAEQCSTVPFNPANGDERLAADIESSQVTVILAERAEWQRSALTAACARTGALGLALLDHAPWVEVVVPTATGSQRATAVVGQAGVAIHMLTSGTTGPPKRIAISYRELENMMDAVGHYNTRRAGATVAPRVRPAIVSAPLVHSSGFGSVVRTAYEGRPLVLLPRFAADAWATIVERHAIGYTGLPPTALRMLLDADIDPARLRSLRALGVGTAALDPDLADRFEERFGIPLLPVYGATEFPGGLTGWTLAERPQYWLAKRGSVGRSHGGVALRLVDQQDRTTVIQEGVGLLSVRTPAMADDTWALTNDLASIDEDGFVYIHGRADDAIIRGGFKIDPREVEKALEAHPDVRAAAVVGMPDERLGAVPVAVVELELELELEHAGATSELPDEQALVRWLRDRLAGYQVPVAIEIVEAIPRTAAMKVSRPGVLALFGTTPVTTTPVT